MATTPTGGQNFVGLYSPAGTRLASVGVDSDITTTGVKTTTVGPVKVPAGFVWAAFLFNAVTPPQMHRSQTGLLNRHNVGLPVERYRFARAGTGLTSLPASIDPAANTGGTVAPAWWAAIR
ncbi:MAG: hypothetical protein L0Y54_23065 [Sporichthyaceae bacterium]|nr:hypothetical protein [Sporichthyaceae bacterium]